MTPHSFYTRFSKVLYAVKLLDYCYEEELDVFFYSFPKEHIQDYVYHDKRDFYTDTPKDVKNFSRATIMLTCQRKTVIPMIVITVWVNCLIRIMMLSSHVTTPKMQLTLYLLVIPTTNLMVNLALTDTVMPECHVPKTDAASAKTKQWNGLILPFIILPLVQKWQRILTLCTNPLNPPNPMTLICQHNILLCRHVVTAIVTPLITPTINNVLPNVATLVTDTTVIHTVVTVMMMITVASAPLVLAMIPILDLVMFAFLANYTLIFLTPSMLVPQVLPLPFLCILAMLFLTQILIILNMSRNIQLTPIMMTTAFFTLARHPPNPTTLFSWAPSTSAITQTTKPNNMVTGTTPNWMHNPQLS